MRCQGAPRALGVNEATAGTAAAVTVAMERADG